MGISALIAEAMNPLRSLSNIIVADLGIRIGAVGVGWRSMVGGSILSSSMSYFSPKLFRDGCRCNTILALDISTSHSIKIQRGT